MTGHDVVYEETKDLSQVPPFMVDAMKTIEEFGGESPNDNTAALARYIGRKLIAKRIGYAPEADVNALLPYLNHQPHSFADWVKSADWSGVFK